MIPEGQAGVSRWLSLHGRRHALHEVPGKGDQPGHVTQLRVNFQDGIADEERDVKSVDRAQRHRLRLTSLAEPHLEAVPAVDDLQTHAPACGLGLEGRSDPAEHCKEKGGLSRPELEREPPLPVVLALPEGGRHLDRKRR